MNTSQRPGPEEWRQIIDGHRPSGLTVAAYCLDRGITQGSFYTWKRRFRSPAKLNRLPKPAAFVEVTPPRVGTADTIAICLRGERRLLARRGFDRLAELAQVVTNQNPMDGHLFLFRSRGGDRLKILLWERDGFVLWYKRLEEGVFKMPRIEGDAKSVEPRASELAMMLDGIDLWSIRRVKRFSRKKQPA